MKGTKKPGFSTQIESHQEPQKNKDEWNKIPEGETIREVN